MWLIDRLLPPSRTPRPADAAMPPSPLEAPARRLSLKRGARAGRAGMAPWQKVAPLRRGRH